MRKSPNSVTTAVGCRYYGIIQKVKQRYRGRTCPRYRCFCRNRRRLYSIVLGMPCGCADAQSLTEISLEQTCEGLTVAGFVSCHLMYGVVNGIEVQLLCESGKLGLTLGRAALSLYTHGKVALGGIGNALAEHFCELSCVLSLLKCCLLPVQTYLGIALSVCDSRDTCRPRSTRPQN